MIYRVVLFVAALGALGLLGGWWLSWPGAALGLLAGAALVAVVDTLRARRFIRWVRAPGPAQPPVLRGLWGEAAYRTGRALRREREVAGESAQRLQDFLSAIQASPHGVVLLDAEGRIEWCNDLAAEHFGFDPARDMRQSVVNLVRAPGFAAYLAAGRYERDVEMPGRRDAPGHPVKLSVQLYPYGEGHKLMLSRDITALAQADAMRRDFVANVSHEIRTPLTVLAGFVETLQTLPLGGEERARYLALMAAQSQRMQTLVDDLLMLSRLEGSPPPGAGEWTDLRALTAPCEAQARALSALLYPAEGGAPQRLAFHALPALAVSGAEKELQSALSNLINNAVRYTPAGGAIEVRWEPVPGGGGRLAVSDTGPGVAPEHVLRLGERFYRVDRSRSRESGGTGLGLAIAKHVAQRHGGEVQISSQLGKGSTFALLLPAQRLRPAAPASGAPGG